MKETESGTRSVQELLKSGITITAAMLIHSSAVQSQIKMVWIFTRNRLLLLYISRKVSKVRYGR